MQIIIHKGVPVIKLHKRERAQIEAVIATLDNIARNERDSAFNCAATKDSLRKILQELDGGK